MQHFKDLQDSYIRYALHERRHKPNTVKQTTAIVRDLWSFVQAEQVTDIDTRCIREFLHTKSEQKKWSAKTFRNYRQCLKTFFSWAIEEGMINGNPAEPIKQPRLPRRLPRCRSNDEVRIIFERIREYDWYFELQRTRNESLIAVMTYGGIRFEEAQTLRDSAVDFKAREIRIDEGKNEKDRIIPIGTELLEILERYAAEKKRLGIPSQWFFPSVKSEKKLTKKNLNEVFKKISELVGFKVTAHMLRHTFGRLCVERGVNLRVIQTVLGHSDIKTTELYTFVAAETAKKALRDFTLNEESQKFDR